MAKIKEVSEAVKSLIESTPSEKWTVRQLYYRLVSPPFQIIENTRSSYKNFDRQLVKLRESGLVKDGAIVDTARRMDGGDMPDWENPEEYLDSLISEIKREWQYYTKSYWKNQPYNVLIVLEKDALSRTIKPVLDKYHIPAFIGRGYSSRTQLLEIYKNIKEDKENIILYLGDHDPTGLDIERSLKERLEYENNGFHEVEIRRVALTYEQARNLPPNPTKSTDPRTPWYYQKFGPLCWELDAMPPQELRATIAEEIERLIDRETWERTIRAEAEGQRILKEKLESLDTIIKKHLWGD